MAEISCANTSWTGWGGKTFRSAFLKSSSVVVGATGYSISMPSLDLLLHIQVEWPDPHKFHTQEEI